MLSVFRLFDVERGRLLETDLFCLVVLVAESPIPLGADGRRDELPVPPCCVSGDNLVPLGSGAAVGEGMRRVVGGIASGSTLCRKFDEGSFGVLELFDPFRERRGFS